jgi:uncharacterized membrane protein
MDAKRFVIGSIVGGIVLFLTGYVLFNILLTGFYEANMGSATGVPREPPLMWAIAVGCLGYAALITYAMGARASLGVSGGAKVGAIVGLLIWVTADFLSYGTMNVANLAATLVDPLAGAVHGAIGGAVIALVISKIKPG